MQNDADNTAPGALCALDWPFYNVTFAYNDGEVTHRLRRPQRQARDGNDFVNEAVKFFALTKSETFIKNGKRRTPAASDDATHNWLYDRLIKDVQGFEMPFGDGFCDELNVIYKKQALNAMAAYRVEILHEKTRRTMKGGSYVVKAWHGPESAEHLVGEFTFDFWSEATKSAYKRSISIVEERKGEEVVETVDMSMFEYLKVFDACIQSATGCGVTVGDEVRPATVAELREHADDFLKLRIAVLLVTQWERVQGK
jgi:hypothetical protein